ncbi:hypothetical protein STANM309S_06235 [Streptomyces tanashiensis]
MEAVIVGAILWSAWRRSGFLRRQWGPGSVLWAHGRPRSHGLRRRLRRAARPRLGNLERLLRPAAGRSAAGITLPLKLLGWRLADG